MFSKASVALTIGFSSILVVADVAAALDGVNAGYPIGMPLKCSGLYPSPVYTPGVHSVPVSIPTPPAGAPSVPTPPVGAPSVPIPPVGVPSVTVSVPTPVSVPSIPVPVSNPVTGVPYTPSVPVPTVPVPTFPVPTVPATTVYPPTGVPTYTPTPTTVTVTVTPTATTISQCNTGAAQCCNSVQQSSHDTVVPLLGLLGVVVQGVDVLVGLGCSPIKDGVALGANCAQQPVCCSNNNYNGLVNIGCTPISL